MTASFGVAQADTVNGVDGGLSRIMQRADKALYSAKTSGRNRVVVWYPQRESA